ncbi:transporter substrate-binding domain-containing protein [Pseudomonas sp. CAU 1711]|uniref:substrate-binding periplasmic protein n=1 Tax=Pseudomonas sp. CAU 1711 TaxID=3140356 RepID=UPI0032602C64
MAKTEAELTRRQFVALCAVSLVSGNGWGGAESAPLSVAYADSYPPISQLEGDRVSGLIVELLNHVFTRQLKIAVEHFGYPWLRAQHLVKNGTHDALCATATAERLEYAVASQEIVLTQPYRVFVRKDHPNLEAFARVRSLGELHALNPRVISFTGNGWAGRNLQGFDLVEGPSPNVAMGMLVGGRGDVIVENIAVGRHWLRSHQAEAEIQMLNHDLSKTDWQLLINKHSPWLNILPHFDVALRAFKSQPAYAEVLARHGVSG